MTRRPARVLLVEVFREGLVAPAASVGADPCALTLHVLAIFVGLTVIGAHGDDQRTQREGAQVDLTLHVDECDGGHVLA